MLRLPTLCSAAALLALAACHDTAQTAASVAAETDSAGRLRSYGMADFDFSRFEGMYGGDFGGEGDIRVAIRHAGGRTAVGYSLHKGLRRNISGDMLPAGNGFDFRLAEPGDNPYDGTFEFHIDTVQYALEGRWTPASKGTLKEKRFSLRRLEKDTSRAEYDLVYTDSLGDLTLHPNGRSTYSYYNRREGKEVGQLMRFHGNWQRQDKTIRIDWEANSVFPSRRSSFRMTGEGPSETAGNADDFGYYILKGEDRELYPAGE